MRRSGSVRSAPKNTRFNPIGKLIAKSVVPESISASVGLCSPGEIVLSHTELSVMLWPRKVQKLNL